MIYYCGKCKLILLNQHKIVDFGTGPKHGSADMGIVSYHSVYEMQATIEGLEHLLEMLFVFENALTEKDRKSISSAAFEALKRVGNIASQFDAPSTTSITVPSEREDSLRRGRVWEESDRPSLLREEGESTPDNSDNPGEEEGFFGVVGRSGEVGDRDRIVGDPARHDHD